MRISASLPALLIAASASAQTVNTQVNGLTLTNGLSSLSDTSALYNGPNISTGVTYLTDNDTTTFNVNIGETSGQIQGTFGGPTSSSATGVYIIGGAFSASWNNYTPTLLNGGMSIQLILTSGLSASNNCSDANFIITNQLINSLDFYQNGDGSVITGFTAASGQTSYYSYAYIPFADFGTTYDQVVGIKLANLTLPFPDISYISLGYSGAPAVPEPSTYGLMLGGLALVGAVIRRRRSK